MTAGALAQDPPTPAPTPAAACDPGSAGTELIDLLDPIGTLACKVPRSVQLADVMGKLTGTLGALTAEQLRKLPELIQATITVQPTALEPFFSLSAKELNAALPLLTEVSADTLKVVFPLLAQQPEGTMDKMLKFLSLISYEQLQRVDPAFSRITQGQLNILVKALNTLPAASWDALIKMVQGLGPVTDVVVAAHQMTGQLPTTPGNSPGESNAVIQWKPIKSLINMNVNANANAQKSVPGGSRKMLQTAAEEDAAAAALAAAAMSIASQEASAAPAAPAPAGPPPVGYCKTSDEVQAAGAEVGVGLLGGFGAVVCKFGAEELRPTMTKLLAILNEQSEATLGNLPAFTDALTRLDPSAFEAFFKIPVPTLTTLIPVLEGVDQKVITAQLKAIGGLSGDDVKKMVFFLNNTLLDRIAMLVPLFSKLSMEQVESFAKLTNSLSPGQIVLSIHLLDTFGFAVDAIGQHIPQQQASSGAPSFWIGPIKVTVADSSSSSSSSSSSQVSRPAGFASLFRHPIFGSFFG
ncbi:hypothetical protein OEZ85_005563 [Tetradesmus obliquus]|uniref:Uncharacterized protein n=1 Tax=Tetradesmus obliquus TaxID=3088 RepID=A0ABY8UGS8_TETOB|nr:hypothetical protein OEZ85_005563 [Tetradesmus obliquus]